MTVERNPNNSPTFSSVCFSASAASSRARLRSIGLVIQSSRSTRGAAASAPLLPPPPPPLAPPLLAGPPSLSEPLAEVEPPAVEARELCLAGRPAKRLLHRGRSSSYPVWGPCGVTVRSSSPRLHLHTFVPLAGLLLVGLLLLLLLILQERAKHMALAPIMRRRCWRAGGGALGVAASGLCGARAGRAPALQVRAPPVDGAAAAGPPSFAS
jgi:hypothetical protein